MIGKSNKTLESQGIEICYICGMNEVRSELLILCEQCYEETGDNSIYDTMERFEV